MDGVSGRRCLLDTGRQISLWPASSTRKLNWSSGVPLIAANGTPIKSYGMERRKIKIGHKLYSFMFINADVARPILGIDFLQRFGMTLDLARRCLLHSGATTIFSSTSGQPAVSSVNLVSDFASTAETLIAQFPEITDVSRSTRSSKHGVECFIQTTGQRRLTPEKL